MTILDFTILAQAAPEAATAFDSKAIFLHPIAIGFYIGSIFTILSLFKVWRLSIELSRFRRHLSDKLEVEAQTMMKMRSEQETLRKENESLRIKVNALNEAPDRKVVRDLEVYARAERRMLMSAPGFGPAWEAAKSEADENLSEEEAGRSAPKRWFSRFFGGSTTALPATGEERPDGQKVSVSDH